MALLVMVCAIAVWKTKKGWVWGLAVTEKMINWAGEANIADSDGLHAVYLVDFCRKAEGNKKMIRTMTRWYKAALFVLLGQVAAVGAVALNSLYG